jgi:hypothetical protein
VGAPRIFGNKGILRSVIHHIFCFRLEYLSSLGEEPCDDVKIVYVGFMLLEYESPPSLSNQLTPRKEIKREFDPLWSIEIR